MLYQWFASIPLAVTQTSDMAPILSKEFLDIKGAIECRFTLKLVPVWLNGWVFVYELSGWGFQSHCGHSNFRYGACFEQGVPWHSGIYRV